MDKVLSMRFDESDLFALSNAVYSGYKAVDHLYKVNPVLGNFYPGIDQRPRLINVFVESHLTKINNPGFHYEVKKNAAGNCSHVRLYKDKATITAHYLGSTTTRKMARSAICRSPLASLNYDLFDFFESAVETDNSNKDLYCHLYHGGLINPDFVMLVIPENNQNSIIGKPLLLPKVELDKAKVEEIEENLNLNLLIGLSDEERYQEKIG